MQPFESFKLYRFIELEFEFVLSNQGLVDHFKKDKDTRNRK